MKKKLNKEFFAVESILYLTQMLIIVLVAGFASDFLSNQARLVAFGETKLNAETLHELGWVLLASFAVYGLLSATRDMFGCRFLSKVLKELRHEFPRILYLFGSTISGVALSIAIYVANHPDAKAKTWDWWCVAALITTLAFFGSGIGLKAALRQSRGGFLVSR